MPVTHGLIDTRDARLVVEHLEHLISSQELQPGDRLPTERALGQSLACSRTDIRRALLQLEIDGRVVRHVGRGTFVAPPRNDSSDASIISVSPAELMAARLLMEPQIASMAALTATQADFDEMQRCLAGGDGADIHEEFEAWDVALHRSFAIATHNGVITAIVDILHSSRHDPSWGGLKRRTFNAARCHSYRDEHRRIVKALQERDALAAEQAMRQHLESVRTTILG
ncbi:FCD domain-containing protein [Arthrobacter sp. NPDC089319]|uniref:FadR/GntR family transcriptional regulator n=1 Tax=Arthrobacter sp. NPDC089319 TaxID=3155915 RepID=UPI00341A0FCA